MEPSLRDQLHCQKERSNDKDRYVIAVVDDGVTVGQLPRKVLLIGSLCIKRGGTTVYKFKMRSTSLFAKDIASGVIFEDKLPLGSGNPLVGFKLLYKSMLIERCWYTKALTHSRVCACVPYMFSHAFFR